MKHQETEFKKPDETTYHRGGGNGCYPYDRLQ